MTKVVVKIEGVARLEFKRRQSGQVKKAPTALRGVGCEVSVSPSPPEKGPAA